LLFILAFTLVLPVNAQPYGERPEVQAFITDLVQRHGFAETELRQLFSKVTPVDGVMQLMVPAERPPWCRSCGCGAGPSLVGYRQPATGNRTKGAARCGRW
jgi:hypothetical protein